jgi:hypothetical protein
MTRSHDPLKLSRLEVLGAWLHIWTPHRDAEIPPIPWRKIGIYSAVTVVVLGIAAAIIVPKVDSAKKEGAARDAKALAGRQAVERARIIADQRAHYGTGERPQGFAKLPTSAQMQARADLFGAAQAAVLADARRRAEQGSLQGPIKDVRCETTPPGGSTPAHPESDLKLRSGAWDCTAITDHIQRTSVNVAGALGYPFRLKVDFRRFTYVWCKQNPVAGERSVPDPSRVVPLPAACRI